MCIDFFIIGMGFFTADKSFFTMRGHLFSTCINFPTIGVNFLIAWVGFFIIDGHFLIIVWPFLHHRCAILHYRLGISSSSFEWIFAHHQLIKISFLLRSTFSIIFLRLHLVTIKWLYNLGIILLFFKFILDKTARISINLRMQSI